MLRLIATVILSALVATSIAGAPPARHDSGITISQVPMLDRFPSKCIISIFQDDDGEIWFGTEDGLCRDNGHSIKVYYPVNVPGVSIDDNTVTMVTADGNGRIWFGTDKGAFILDKRTQKITSVEDRRIISAPITCLEHTADGSVWLGTEGMLYRFAKDGTLMQEYPTMWNNRPASVRHLYQDSAGRIWSCLSAGGICLYDSVRDSWEYFPWPFKVNATRIIEDISGTFFWVGTWLGGIVRFDPAASGNTPMFTEMQHPRQDDERDYAILDIVRDDARGYLWATTMNGLKVFQPGNGTLTQIEGLLPGTDRYQMLTRLIKDKDGNIWVGGYNVPSFIISFTSGITTNYLEPIRRMSSHIASISQLCADDDPEKLWLFQERHRLYLYDHTTGKVECEVSSSFADTHNNVGSIYLLRRSRRGKGVLACGLNPTSVYRIYESDGKIRLADHIDFSAETKPRALLEDRNGDLWIGTENTLFTYDTDTKTLSRKASDTGKVVDIKECSDGTVAVATTSTDNRSQVTWFSDGIKGKTRHFDIECTAIAVTGDSSLWLGTRTGEIFHTRNGSTPTPLSSQSDFMPMGYIAGLFVDAQNHVWVQTEQRITEIIPHNLSIHNYYVDNNHIGLFNFFPQSYEILPSGNIVFGGTGGICEITPSPDSTESRLRSIYISEIKVDGSPADIPTRGSKLRIPSSCLDLEIEFSINEHLNAPHTAYTYRLGDGDWIKLAPGTNKAHLNRLPAGESVFEVKCISDNGTSSAASDTYSITINRQPYFYETIWFKVMVALAVLAVATVILAQYSKRKNRQQREKLEEELTQAKLRFFTNITHELRTPLTLLLTPLESIISRLEEGTLRKQLKGIHKSAIELMTLINKILNFRRLEMGCEKINLSKGDIIGFIEGICDSFKPLATEKQIDFSFTSDRESLYTCFDIAKIRIVINNLLSNAFKFTKPGDTITVATRLVASAQDTGRSLEIAISDSGIGIPPSKINHIFDRFYQVDNPVTASAGSGIGLHVAHEYTLMHKGSIDVESAPGRGTTFRITLPLADRDETAAAPAAPDGNSDAETAGQARKTILIVEDNADFREFMQTELAETYSVISAPDAFDGEQLARERHPDIIISDVMMPGRDGYELCRILKNDVETSDIPVVLLTARSDDSAEMSAYENQADAFVHKPFNLQMLLNRISNLIAARAKRHSDFRSEPETDIDKLKLSPIDHALLEKIKECIDRNLTNSDYSVAELSSDVCMSRMNLYRKLLSITGQTPSDFIKTIRLKKAACMLLEKSTTIVDVAYAVGYSTPSYFTRSFKNEFGMTPRQYIEKNR